jgi:hypothetical protein
MAPRRHREGRRAALVEHLQHADRAAATEQRHGRDRARHVAGASGGLAVEARISLDVGERQCLAGAEGEAGDALGRLHRLADGARTLRPGRDPELEPLRIVLEQRDR